MTARDANAWAGRNDRDAPNVPLASPAARDQLDGGPLADFLDRVAAARGAKRTAEEVRAWLLDAKLLFM